MFDCSMYKKQMKIMKWIAVGMILCFSAGQSAFAQADRIIQAMEDGNFKRALKLAEDAEEDSDLRKDPEIYFLKAEVILELMKDKFYHSKNPESLKIGFKALEKGKQKNDGSIFSSYNKVVDEYVILNNEEAYSSYKINKYLKAASIYEKSYELNQNPTSYFWVGKCTIIAGDTSIGETYYKETMNYCRTLSDSGDKPNPEFVEIYIHFADKYWVKQDFDSANLYLISGRAIFGGNPRLDYYQREIAIQQIKALPPSSLMMEKVRNALFIFPTDTFFIKKENALVLFMLRNNLSNKDSASFDTMLNRFVREKLVRSNSEFLKAYLEADQFLDTKAENVIWKLVAYYGKYDHEEASNFLADRYIRQTAATLDPKDIRARYLVIIDFAAKSKSLSLANQILEHAVTIYGENVEFSGLRSSLVSSFSDKTLNTNDQGALYNLMLANKKDLKKEDEPFEKIAYAYIDALIKDREYIKAKAVVNRHFKAQPDNPVWNRKLIFIAKEDFYHNYYMTKVREEEVAGMRIPGFEWNGSTSGCEAGSTNPEINQKVENRINYFRRQAGVPTIYLDPELNGWCQEAALIFETNKKINHELTPKWSCYTDAGAQAAKYSLLTEGAHTTVAVTSFFADNRNPSVGNRRWLLYPNGKALGHGSTTNYCAIWALDDSGNVDTNKYKDQFVAWPPEGYVPKMMAFNFWSFSLDQDLTDATVSMTENSKIISTKIMESYKGYGLPTLVWQPGIDLSEIKEDRVFHIAVTLINGRRYDYDVRIMDFDPVGY
ncbi:MAG: hypothetical protein ACI8ZN_000302 [Bacteroidia bacterium]